MVRVGGEHLFQPGTFKHQLFKLAGKTTAFGGLRTAWAGSIASKTWRHHRAAKVRVLFHAHRIHVYPCMDMYFLICLIFYGKWRYKYTSAMDPMGWKSKGPGIYSQHELLDWRKAWPSLRGLMFITSTIWCVLVRRMGAQCVHKISNKYVTIPKVSMSGGNTRLTYLHLDDFSMYCQEESEVLSHRCLPQTTQSFKKSPNLNRGNTSSKIQTSMFGWKMSVSRGCFNA